MTEWTKVTDALPPDDNVIEAMKRASELAERIYDAHQNLKEKALGIICEACPVLVKDRHNTTIYLHDPVHIPYRYSVEYRGVLVAKFEVTVCDDEVQLNGLELLEDNSTLEVLYEMDKGNS